MKPLLRELIDENKSLREALAVYGGHCGGCNYGETIDEIGNFSVTCTCGFRQVWQENGLQGIVDGKRAKDSQHTDLGSGGV